jgi:hypothetical protein
MKKISIIASVFCVFVLAGCVGTTALGILDETIPEEAQCPTELKNISVILYDNKPVEWGPAKFTDNKAIISLPPGEHKFTARYYESRNIGGGMSQTYPVAVKVEKEFLPGHSYRIYKQSIWIIFATINTVKIKDITPKEKK